MDQDTLFQLLQALQGKQWYAAVGLGLMVAIAVARVVAPAVWNKIPTRWQWVPAVVGAGAVAVIDAWQSGVAWQQAIALAVYAMVTGAGVAIGGWHTVKRITGGAAEKPVSVTVAGDELKVTPTGITIPYDPTEKHAASDPPGAA